MTSSEQAEISDLPEVQHEGTTSTNPLEPVNRHENERDDLQFAQPEPEVTAPSLVSVDPPTSLLPAASKDKPITSPTKRLALAPAIQTATTAKTVTSGPPTPQVKKILHSGKFGTGITKALSPPISKSTNTPAAVTGKLSTTEASSTLKPLSVSNPATKKSPVSTSGPISKAAMPPKLSTPTPSVPASARRTSLAPTKPTAPPARSSTLSGSSSGKLPSTVSSSSAPKPSSAAPSRASVVSPDSTASAKSAVTPRPRASVSEGVLSKKSAGSKSSLTPSTKPPTPATARPGRIPGAGSISSLKEVKEDGAALIEIQNKLNEATASLDLKSNTISELEYQIEELKVSVDSITADLEAARQNVEDAELAKAAADKDLAEAKAALATLHTDGDKLRQLPHELETAKMAAVEQSALIETLRAQIQTLQNEVDEARENLEALRAAHSNDSDIVAAAEIDRQALVKAKADLEAISIEAAALKTAQAEALGVAAAKISTLELQGSLAEALATEVDSLRAEKEETSNKLSELEVEILELKEAQELAEEERGKSNAQIRALHAEVARAAEATDKAVREAVAKESAAAEHLDEAKKQHADALALAAQETKKLSERLHVLQAEIGELRNNLEAANAAAASTAEEHTHRLLEAEKAHQARQDELTAEIERVSAELEAQEAMYNAKVQIVKDEHSQHLQQAFERAKNEAGDAHGQDLQTLREKSEVAIEQLQSSHLATVEGLKAEHEAALASGAQTFQKQQSSLTLELKATSEDLAKAKATLSASLQEVETLKVQLEETRQAVQAAVSAAAADQDADTARLNKELSNARDDLNGLNEVFRATQESMQEMSKNHHMELEEAAKGRAEEVSKLRAVHDAEIQSLVADKSNLVTKLSDLEGELVTLRASAASAEAASSPKRNGSAAVPVETVTKEELQRMHEAHNLKINDLQAQHDKDVRYFQEQLDDAVARANRAEQDLERKKMEIAYLEQDQEESQDQITRLKEDVEHLTRK